RPRRTGVRGHDEGEREDDRRDHRSEESLHRGAPSLRDGQPYVRLVEGVNRGSTRSQASPRAAYSAPYRRSTTRRMTSASSTTTSEENRITDETAITCGSWLGTRSCANR